MDRAFDKSSNESNIHASNGFNDSLISNQTSAHKIVDSNKPAEPKRKKLAERMLDQDDAANSNVITSPDRKSQATSASKQKKSTANKKSTLSEFLSHSHPEVPASEDEVLIPVKPYREPSHKARETRSSTKSRNVWIERY